MTTPLSSVIRIPFLTAMRLARIKREGTSYYHCVSRVVEGRFLFRTQGPASAEAEHFVYLMRRLERACQVQVLTYALMANHFHILCKVPQRQHLSDSELLDCIEAGYGVGRRNEVAERLRTLLERPDSDPSAVQQVRKLFLDRLFDVSVFMKELKGRFAQWYNRRHRRYGVLWAERFKSVLIEAGPALNAVAAYIDLNPLRAGLCEDPKDYRYCGYAEAIAKNSDRAKLGLMEVLGFGRQSGWKEASREYRKMLFLTGVSASKAAATIDPEIVQKVVEQQKGAIALHDLLRCRIRYFTDGGIIGSRAFVQEQFARFKRSVNPPKTKRGYLFLTEGERQIWILRNLRLRPIG